MTEFIINTPEYSGLFAVLYDKIKAREITLATLDLYHLVQQYATYYQQSSSKTFEAVIDFLPLLAKLLVWKSQALLPVPEVVLDEDDEEIMRSNLIHKLLEYQKIRDITPFFQQKAQERQQIFTKMPQNLKYYQVPAATHVPLAPTDPAKLQTAIDQLFIKLVTEQKFTMNLPQQNISIEDRLQELMVLFAANPEKNFFLMELLEPKQLSLPYFIATFIALLDLVKQQQIIIIQPKSFDIIQIRSRKEHRDV